MDFCERCGRYLNEGDRCCPECGCPVPGAVPQQPQMPMPGQAVVVSMDELKKQIFDKYFFITFALTFAATLTVSYFYSSFALLFFCIPLFMPMRKLSVGAGMMLGIMLGSISGLMLRFLTYASTASILF